MIEVADNDPRFSRADSKSGQLQRLAYRHIITEHYQNDLLPTSLRFLFYEMEQLGLVSKEKRVVQPGKMMARRADQDFIDALTDLRERDIIPWDWIVDETREVSDWECAPSVLEYLQNQLPVVTIDPWVGVPKPVILCEARTAGGVLRRSIGPRYSVAIAPTNGQTRGYLITKVAPLFLNRDCVPLYAGDRDDAGDDIEDNTRRVLERALGKPLDNWRRIAITDEQLAWLRGRGVQPIQKRDNRYTDGNPHLAYELEALGQGYLTELVEATLDAMLPEPLDDVLERERTERGEWERFFKAVGAMTALERAAFLRSIKA